MIVGGQRLQANPAGIPEPELAGSSAARYAAAMPIVLDTNIALDLLLFEDPACASLAEALAAGRQRWMATAAMREEFARVLGYPLIAARLAQRGRDAAALLSAFDALAQPVAPAPPAPCRCGDPDDQMFIDLAVAHRCLLLSKDQAVLSMRKGLAALGVAVRPALVIPAAARQAWSAARPAA
jgi:predicted nucleic acid-binding protein